MQLQGNSLDRGPHRPEKPNGSRGRTDEELTVEAGGGPETPRSPDVLGRSGGIGRWIVEDLSSKAAEEDHHHGLHALAVSNIHHERSSGTKVVRLEHYAPEPRTATLHCCNANPTSMEDRDRAVLGYAVALLPPFDDARNFARYGREKARVRVYPYENPWFTGRRGHYISLTRIEEMVVVQLSILLRTQYFVVLASDRDVPVRATAHFFDLTANRLKEMDPLPIRPGRPLKGIKA